MKRLHGTALPAVSSVAVTFLLTACATSPAQSVPADEPTPTPASAEPQEMMLEPDAAHECGQVSALQGILYRSQWEHDQGVIDDAAYAARVAAVEDGWTYLGVGGTEVTAEIKAAQQAMGGGIGPDNAEFVQAVDEVARACDAAGSLIVIGALPGQGG